MNSETFSRIVTNLADIAGNTPNVGIGSIAISTPGDMYEHNFVSPDQLFDVRSISKVAVALAIGAAIDQGFKLRSEPVTLDMSIAPFFEKELRHAGAAQRFEPVKLRHLISNTIGHKAGFLFRADVQTQDPDDLLPYIFVQPMEYAPGSHFSYSNVGWYLWSAILERELGVSLSDWVSQYVFSTLGVQSFEWKKYGKWEIGGSGLCLRNDDLHKMGQLFVQDGEFNGSKVVPPEWLAKMHSHVSETTDEQDPERYLQYVAYGYSLWSAASGTFYCDGAAGQYLLVVPSQGLVLTTVGDVAVMNQVSYAFREILD